ncbi:MULTISPECIES: 1-aminocyclopropane-1-carboxylate deaminase/D-cysteine desulfhydrase [Chryseobacterium]|jgi:1-aminocyclopropane-1-carboxylate deaminase|uniref:1-aminocyclopropane-1-carboxylate deaminase/D-cysteine desulfhydrase n=1 Tax=Chryseobacterium rhizosphaerae TaxID=395937 RepID=A0AAE4C5M8_9FLAO|nr:MULTISPECIES: pyridoxal-phosphate dependent enzyme [Chryseobacterium]MDR6527825.1 1-aminocyclopropane-1-carboxylate deaminase/D-cysteine desulfhydrase-like pyridoxal-dependent ACC family enzyme [Chryseobacterium rhizosphaerae]REC75032.1 1-aminocyclopropane-1-carboxylate deaminase/D-cysteine desulfhydrase [Chryseobacterium rhizosphaerae]GEN69905.1 1-aminocyclopropane-1-carboxylate deaminase [Chryseobacterium rhizosphaerae]
MLLQLPTEPVPIQEIFTDKKVSLFIKREDLIHPQVSGNKYWKLFYNINKYLEKNPENPYVITFGGAFSNHISAVSAAGNMAGIPTLGIIRGEELQNKWRDNPTLVFAKRNGMNLKFVTREEYRHKEKLTEFLQQEFPDALIVPEGGTNEEAVEGIKMMLNEQTKDFDYLCTAVGTGGTIAGISRFCEENQNVIGFKVVDDTSLEKKIGELTLKHNFNLIDSSFGGYGKINDENIRFINDFKEKYNIPLEPIYTGKMMQRVFELMEQDYFPENSRILCFHTGGLQGIEGANLLLEKQNRNLII